MFPSVDDLTRSRPPGNGRVLGTSREGRPIVAYRYGRGDFKVSLIAGCHADEPVGPQLLDLLVRFLEAAPPSAAILRHFDWWIVPHLNPDGREKNRAWTAPVADTYDLSAYLRHARREAPGDDIEFGFPRSPEDEGARPENRAVFAWWRTSPSPFRVHASLHGMAFAGGPWYLIDPAWRDRSDIVIGRCRATAHRMGYSLHDVERHGDKGFVRIDRGFSTTPNSRAMAAHFRRRGDEATAALFRPSSMEAVRSLGGDPLALVSEIPLFVLRGVGETIEPTDDVADRWRERLAEWKRRATGAGADHDVGAEALAAGARPVPIGDQLRLIWEFVQAGMEQAGTPH